MMAPMRGLFIALTILSLSSPVWAQWSSPINPTFTNSIESEEVETLPPAIPSPTAATTPATSSQLQPTAQASVAQAAPFTVKGISIDLSNTTGFARDAALDQAAAKGLPLVLVNLPMPETLAQETARSVGDPMRFVASYAVVKETLIPNYSLIADLTFNEAMLRTNFGGKSTAVENSVSTSTVASATPLPPPPLQTYLIQVNTADPIHQDEVYRRLTQTSATTVRYKSMARGAAQLEVTTPLSGPEVASLLEGTSANLQNQIPSVPTSPTQSWVAAASPTAPANLGVPLEEDVSLTTPDTSAEAN